MKIHYTHSYLIQPGHKITVDLVGVGGTGCRMLTNLARINEGLVGLGHPGLHVRSWDDDIVTAANKGRQLFSDADLGLNKAIVLTTRINRFFGYEWEAVPEYYGGQKGTSNILITCVDTAKSRVMLDLKLSDRNQKNAAPPNIQYYWLDLGNTQKAGQCVLGTFQKIEQPTSEFKTKAELPNVIKKFPQIKKMIDKDDKSGPSCSIAEALEKQDLCINTVLAEFGTSLLWQLLRDHKIKHHGCFVNLETFVTNPIKIQ